MTLGINQPYFFPYLGYFQLISAVDAFVLLDNVQYIRRSWITRNRILCNGAPRFISLPIDHASTHRDIASHLIAPPLSGIARQVEDAYRKAPFFDSVFPMLEDILNYPDLRLNRFLLHSLHRVCRYLGITTPLTLCSETIATTACSREGRIIEICRHAGAERYINAVGGKALYTPSDFSAYGIDLKFINPQMRPYKQMRTQEFVPALSILDVMMNLPADEIRSMLADYTLD